ncbi:MAG: ATP-binding cassette domain-containing protein [Blautia sp.]
MKRRQLDKIRGARISLCAPGKRKRPESSSDRWFSGGGTHDRASEDWKKEAIAEAVKLMKRFHIGDEEEVAAQYPFTYSGGMKQRAMIAMGIIAGADMILADEPTKGLDEERIEMVVDAFHSLKDQAVLCVTHDLNFAREI